MTSSAAVRVGRAPRSVLLYDGECGLCHRVVRLLLRLDATGRLSFAPLQSPPAQAYLRAQNLPARDFESLVFVSDWDNPLPGAYQLRTDGALAALALLDLPWRALAHLRHVPRGLRDRAYRVIARIRYRLFGRSHPTPLSRAEWQHRFLTR